MCALHNNVKKNGVIFELNNLARLDRTIAVDETCILFVMITKQNSSGLKISTSSRIENVCVDKSQIKITVVEFLSTFESYTRTNGHRRPLPRCSTKMKARTSSFFLLRRFRLQQFLGHTGFIFHSADFTANTTIQYISAETFRHCYTLWKLLTDTKITKCTLK